MARNFQGKKYIYSEDCPREIPVTVCRNCNSIDYGDSINCQLCGAGADSVSPFRGWSPQVYVADFAAVSTYDGHVNKEFPNVLSFSIGLEEHKSPEKDLNFHVSSYEGTLININNNGFNGYVFSMAKSKTFSGIYLSKDAKEKSKFETYDWRDPVIEKEVENVALMTERKTDILLARPLKWQEGLLAGDEDFYKLKAAYLSLAEILSKSIVLREDVEPSEVSVGIKYHPVEDEFVEKHKLWSVFIADNLDNGAGYSSNYATGLEFRKLLEYSISRLQTNYLSPTHMASCFTSCYECLKNYTNRFFHSELDWRLGLDLVHYLMGREIKVNLAETYWTEFIENRMLGRLEELGIPGLSYEKVCDFHVFKDSNSGIAIVPVYPLVNRKDGLKINQDRHILAEKTGVTIAFTCPFDLERQPLREIQEIKSQVKR